MQMTANADSNRSSVEERFITARIVLRKKNQVEFFDVESDFSHVIGNGLEVVNGSVPSDNAFHKDRKDSQDSLADLSKLGDVFCEEASKVFDSFKVFNGVSCGFGGGLSFGNLLSDGLDHVFNLGRNFAWDGDQSLDLFDDLRRVDDSASPMQVLFKVFDGFIFLFARSGEFCDLVEESNGAALQISQDLQDRL
jgi:hypothetical protein